jgi:hypothetical protein
MASVDGMVSVSLNVQDGPLNGTMMVSGNNYNVSGGWAAAGSTPDRGGNAFFLNGQLPSGPSTYAVVVGNMVGSTEWPQSLYVVGGTVTSRNGSVTAINEQLLPVLSLDQNAVRSVYSECGCQLNIMLHAVPPYCASGTIGGRAMTPQQCAAVCTGGTPPDPLVINIPPNAGPKPVAVLLLTGSEGPDHFGAPVLAEFHHQILKILFDTSANGLLLEYANTPGSKTNTQPIVFKGQERKRPHASIIIKPQ